MRLLADVIRGMEVEKALAILEFHPQHCHSIGKIVEERDQQLGTKKQRRKCS
jgi:ribosomal protein L22